MSTTNDWNQAIIKEFRENKGKVGGPFAGMDLVLLHTTGAKSGIERINPVAYLTDRDRIAVFASKAGAPSNPDWYYNILAHPELTVEVGSETFQVKASVAVEPERSRLYDKMAAMHSGFGEYQEKTKRVIPVIILTRI
jgi:deazaflavin-dependent oxidoreductase (nitroreductase family)